MVRPQIWHRDTGSNWTRFLRGLLTKTVRSVRFMVANPLLKNKPGINVLLAIVYWRSFN